MTPQKDYDPKTVTIVLADDDPALRKITAKNISNNGYEVFEAEDGQEAVDLVTKHKPDIAILDIMMPKMTGTEACRSIRSNRDVDTTYIIFLTAKDGINDIVNGLSNEKADDYLTKPFNMHELIARIEAGVRITKLQKRLIQKNSKLQGALALQSKFLGLAAHDLRSPLSIINTYISLIGQGVISEDEIKDTCLRRAEGMMQLIDDVLGITKLNSGTIEFEPKKSDITKAVLNSVSLYQPVASNEKIHLKYNIPEEEVICVCDLKRIAEIMENLLSNAIKYSTEGKTVTVNVETKDGNCIIDVIDEGEGILPENLEKIFEPFASIETTLEKQVPHTCLGLAIVKKLVDLHKGKISVFSDGYKKGAKFSITMPIVKK